MHPSLGKDRKCKAISLLHASCSLGMPVQRHSFITVLTLHATDYLAAQPNTTPAFIRLTVLTPVRICCKVTIANEHTHTHTHINVWYLHLLNTYVVRTCTIYVYVYIIAAGSRYYIYATAGNASNEIVCETPNQILAEKQFVLLV